MLEESSHDTVDGELADLLRSMASEGAVNSSGVFTIDIRSALPKLEKFQLPRPHFGVLKVIQSAVASNATYVETSFGSTGITIEHDGTPPTADELRELFSFLLSSQHAAGERALRDLAVGVNTSLARGANWVEVASRQESGWVRQRWASRDETAQLDQPDRGGRANVRFSIRNSVNQVASGLWRLGNNDVMGMLNGSRDTLAEDAQAVFDRCRFAPLKVTINGRHVPANLLSQVVKRRWSSWKTVEHRSGNLLEVYLQSHQESPHLMSAPQLSQARYRLVLPGHFHGMGFESEGRFAEATSQPLPPRRCFAVLGIRSNGRVPGEMVVVKDGVELTRLTPPEFPKGVSVVFTAEGLRLDMSQFRLIDSAETRERVRWVQQMISQACHHALETLAVESWSNSEREHVRALANRLD